MYSHKQFTQRGAAMLFFIIFFVVAASALTFLLGRSIYSDVFAMRLLATSKQSYLTGESALEDVVFRTMTAGYPVTGTEVLTALTGVATTTQTYDVVSDSYLIRTESKVGTAQRVSVVELELGAGTAFNYGLQAGNGGFQLNGNARIIGNVFANGPIVGGGTNINRGVEGDAVSAGPAGSMENLRVTSSARANSVGGSHIVGDLHYNTVGSAANTRSSPIGGTYALIPTPDFIDLPISDAKVEEWKSTISSVIPASACTAGTYLINSDTTIGNVKIECNLEIRKTGGSTVVTLTGPVWVEGNIELTQGPELRVLPTLGRRSVQLIADNPSNRTTSSKIAIRNSTTFIGSGHPSSHVMLLSQNNSSELGGAEVAIEVAQSADGALIIYAGHGRVTIGNNIDLRSVTGHFIEVSNNSSITYNTGLASTLFTGGPGGGYVIAGWYQE